MDELLKILKTYLVGDTFYYFVIIFMVVAIIRYFVESVNSILSKIVNLKETIKKLTVSTKVYSNKHESYFILFLNYIIIFLKYSIEPIFHTLLIIIVNAIIISILKSITIISVIGIVTISLLIIWDILLFKNLLIVSLSFIGIIKNAKFMIITVGLTAKEYIEIASCATLEVAIELGKNILSEKGRKGKLAKGVSLSDEFITY